ncbi:family 20 glycosylhydrolase [Candidatus Sumerlaeota bacterium]|nr:family 20 glycosylhydrolase [Candidatus Sumerlaeota bacterium]
MLHIIKSICVTAIILCSATIAIAAPPEKSKDTMALIERDGIRVEFNKPRGMMVEVDGVPFSSNSHLWVVNDIWNHHYAGYFQNPPFDASFKQTTDTISFMLNGNFNEFEGTQTLQLLGDRKLRIQVDGSLTTNTEANFEFMIASVAAGWYAGRNYKVEDIDGNTSEGTFTITPPPTGKLADFIISPSIKRLEVDTIMGPIVMTVEGTHKVVAADYRNNTWEDNTMLFVNGVFFERTSPKAPIHMTIEYQFPPAKTSAATPESSSLIDTEGIIEDKAVMNPDPGQDYITPRPKSITWGNGATYMPDKTIGIAFEGNKTEKDTAEMKLMVEALNAALDRLCKGKAHIVKRDVAQLVLKLDGTFQPDKYDHYTLVVNEDSGLRALYKNYTIITAASLKGLWSGIGAYRQLFRYADGKFGIRRAVIDDYATLPFRSIQFFTGKDSLELHKKIFGDLMPIIRANPVTYELDYMGWSKFPKMFNKQYGAKNSDVRAIAKVAKQNGIEVVPLINTYGHAEWMIDNPTYKKLADDPEKPFCYDATNPEVYKICEKIYEEAIEIFKPYIIHIGHDEIYAPTFPKKDIAKKVGAKKLIMDDILYWHNFLKKRNIRTMIWGDMFLGPGESIDSTNAKSVEQAKEWRSMLPRDIMFADWHYAPGKPEQYKSVKLLADEGFDVVGAPWYSTVNIVNFTSATAQAAMDTTSGMHALGMMQTTWAGYSFDKNSIDGARKQYAAYVAAADAAWNGGDLPVDKWNYNFFEAFARIMGDTGLVPDTVGGWYADLSADANVTLADLGYPKTEPSPYLGRIRFAPDGKDAAKGVMLYGQLTKGGDTAANALVLNINKKAKKVVFATATPYYQYYGKEIAKTIITYTDGTTQSFNWVMAENTLATEDYRNRPNTPELETVTDPETGKKRYLHAFVWENPKPTKVIKTITLESNKAGCSLSVFGVAGLDK